MGDHAGIPGTVVLLFIFFSIPPSFVFFFPFLFLLLLFLLLEAVGPAVWRAVQRAACTACRPGSAPMQACPIGFSRLENIGRREVLAQIGVQVGLQSGRPGFGPDVSMVTNRQRFVVGVLGVRDGTIGV